MEQTYILTETELEDTLKDYLGNTDDDDDYKMVRYLGPLKEPQSIVEQEWEKLCLKLHSLRLRLSLHDELLIKSILNKY